MLVKEAIPTPPYVLHHRTRGVNGSGGRHIPETEPGYRMVDRRVVPGAERFLLNERLRIDGGPGVNLTANHVVGSAVHANRLLHSIWSMKTVLPGSSNEVSAFDVIMADRKAVSNAVGSAFARGIDSYADTGLTLNPKQSGNPDLLPTPVYERMVRAEAAGEKPEWTRVSSGVELKSTCGGVEEPELSYPCDATRVGMLRSIRWVAHHDKNRCVIGLFWDYMAGVPQIVGVFYADRLVEGDYTRPGEIGERSTNSRSLLRAGLDKFRYVCVLNDARYLDAVSRHLPCCGL